MTATDNALLAARPLNELPDFARIRAEQAEPAVDAVLAESKRKLDELLALDREPTWETFIEPLEALGEHLGQVWGPVSHLFMVRSTAEWRAAYNACLPKVTEYSLELSQSEPLCAAYRRIKESPGFAQLSPVRQKVINDALRDFRLSGIDLPADKKQRYKEIALRLSEIQTKFEENLMDAIKAWSKLVTDESELAGMTDAARQQAREKAKAKGQDGWLLTLDFPSYDAVITYTTNRELRREIYTAYSTRASDQGPQAGQFDNGPIAEEILKLRHEEALLLGFNNYAELSLATKMADSPDEVEGFLRDLARRAKPRAGAELDELRAYAKQLDGLDELQPWDMAFYAEKFKESSLGLSDEELRPYFALPAVLDGLFKLLGRLYGLRCERLPDAPVWHEDVQAYQLLDANGLVGRFYLDPFARDEKRGGAWMDECHNRRRTSAGVQTPVAYLVCNFRPAVGDQPALLTHDEVVTLFHEFGHGLHLLLTQVDEASVAGIHGVEWDAVELPSQFMENWCFDETTLNGFARHYQTGEPIPTALLDKLKSSRVFQSGLATVRQIEFALFDLRLHRDYDPAAGGRVLETLKRARDEVAVMQPPAFNRMPMSFSHIFAGGYAAGYYSYKWAEVLSADAFAAFEESDFAAETGQRFRATILANGGSREARELFREFRGRDPEIAALLRHNGLEVEAA
ncbi:M3 family metallopeptidase [Hydrocarboniphaga effusa]|jgi:oligopeptidase A|uniref:oligopeptidase A n=1 Tax=Hydrocarboniphaga effusa AP103 TaxID=1172194 RepID=I8T9M1_9GAMM|nr:M3 family metallopeptidase [Hydrocarboniphaga effusa]EIT70498.1 Oligopeptidase A [Hydrocarboniphaga effusa AP103]